MGGVLGAGTAVMMSVHRARQAKRVTTYGSARWAERDDIEKAGLLKPAGVFLGRLGGDAPTYLRHDGPEHIMAIAPTRSGKGVGLVVPTLLTWRGSCVVHDIKGRSEEHTSELQSLM